MTIGALRVTLRLHGCHSLKDKRSRVRPILARVREKFPVAAAEVDEQDELGLAVLAFVTVSSSQQVVNSICDKVLNYVDSLGLAEVADSEIELMAW
jgi:uncharacterized protein YlxP (DUF503 family)